MNIKKQIINLIFLSLLLSQSWELQINSQNINDIPGDWVTMGTCDECYDGFCYGSEDLYNQGSMISRTELFFYNPEWATTPSACNEEEEDYFPQSVMFEGDYKSTHPPEDLLIWNISGWCSSDVEAESFFLVWDDDEIDLLDSEYNINLYVRNLEGNYEITDMRATAIKQLQCNELSTEVIQVDQQVYVENTRIKVLLGGCSGSPLATYYEDLDGDGWGHELSIPTEFCYGYEEEGWVDNNEDIDDEIHCISNNIDSCDVCDGQNQDLDCNDICFGSNEEDMCGVCDDNPNNNCDQDCAGNWGGDAQLDCNNDCNGEAELDECEICSGGNSNHEAGSDKDCNDECFGDGVIDYCGDCDGFNLECPDLVFGNGPVDLYAQINLEIVNQIDLTWLYPDVNISDQIVGYNIYQQIEDEYSLLYTLNNINFLSYSIIGYDSGIFCISAYDIYDNETNPICAEASEFNNFTFTLMDGANLISFPYLSNSDATIINIFSSIEPYVEGIIAEGAAASFTHDQGWVGNINEIKRRKGYWLKINISTGQEAMDCDGQECIYFSVAGIETDHNISYTLHEGANLISYIGPDGIGIEDAIPDEVEHLFDGIIGEGQAATQNPNTGWVGNLTHLNIGEGYWVKITPNTPDFNFIWNSD